MRFESRAPIVETEKLDFKKETSTTLDNELNEAKETKNKILKRLKELAVFTGVGVFTLLAEKDPALAQQVAADEFFHGRKDTTIISKDEVESNKEKINLEKARQMLDDVLYSIEFGKVTHVGGDPLENAKLAGNLRELISDAKSIEELSSLYYKFLRKMDIDCDKDVSPELAEYLLNKGMYLIPLYEKENNVQQRCGIFKYSKEESTAGTIFYDSDALTFKVKDEGLYVKEEYGDQFFYYQVLLTDKGVLYEQVAEDNF